MAPLPASALRLEASAVDRLYIAFDVSQPVEQPEDLRGRDLEVQALLSGVLHRRNHGIVSGPRGSGSRMNTPNRVTVPLIRDKDPGCSAAA